MWEMLTEKKEKVIFIGAAIALFFVFRYVFPLIWPFLVGGLLSALLYPVVRFLSKKTHLGKGFCALILMSLLVIFILALLGLCGYGMIEKGYEIFCDYEKYMRVLEKSTGQCCDWIETQLHLPDGMLMKEMRGAVTRMSSDWQQSIVGGVFTGSVSGVKKMVSVGAFFVFTFLSTVLIIKEWDENRGGVFAQVKQYINKVVDFLKIFLGAQVRIIGVIALICLIGYWIAGIKGAFGLALLTATLDFLPFIGTGIVLVPLAVWRVVNAHYYQAFLLLATYICCMIAREYLEPKFISAKTGISPVLTLLGIYVGIRLLGIGGIFLGPLYILIVKILYEELLTESCCATERE